MGGAGRSPCHCCAGVALLRNTETQHAGAVRTWGLCLCPPACALGLAGMSDGLSLPNKHPAHVYPPMAVFISASTQGRSGGDCQPGRNPSAALPMQKCGQVHASRSSHASPATVPVEDPCLGSRGTQRAGTGGCSETLGVEAIPARLSLLTSAEAASCPPEPHSCAIQLQHALPASCGPTPAQEQREAQGKAASGSIPFASCSLVGPGGW